MEGFKLADFAKIELHRESLAKPYLYPNDENIIAIATDHALEQDDHNSPAKLDMNNTQQIADFIETRFLKISR